MSSRDRVLVTGASGLLGSHVVRDLLSAGYPVRALVRQSNPEALAGVECEVALGDVRDPVAVRRALDGCRYIMHSAAAYNLGRRNAREAFSTNVFGTRTVMELAREAGVERIVYTSSVATIGPVCGRAATEDDGPGAAADAGPYERSKWVAELLVHRMVQRDGLPAIIVNPATVVGARDTRPTRTGRLIVDAARGRMPAYVQTGLNFIAAADVAAGHRLALELGAVGRRYILGNENLTLEAFLRLVDAVSGTHRARRHIPHAFAMAAAWLDDGLISPALHREPTVPLAGARLARQPAYYDASRARSELGLPVTPVRDAVEEAVAWFREVGWLQQ